MAKVHFVGLDVYEDTIAAEAANRRDEIAFLSAIRLSFSQTSTEAGGTP